jgi:hypothetical protein
MIYQALTKLGFSDADFVLQNDSDGRGTYIKEWKSASPQPTEAEIEATHAEWEAEHAATQYQRDRKAEYPSIEECVHAILDGELDALQAIRAEIKARYPKP